MTSYRVALIGAGAIASAHVAALRAAGDRVALNAAVDVDPVRLAAFTDAHGIPRGYTSVEEMLAAERPQLVHICTPPSTHYAQIVACLEAGAWVYCEKPLCGSLAEFAAIEAAELRAGCFVSTVFQWRFGSGAQHLKRLLAEGALGQPLVALAHTLWFRDLDYYAVPWRGKWATELGGTTVVHGIHLMDLLLWLMGSEWVEVRAMTGTLDRPIEVDDVSMALVRFENGALASFVSSALSPRQESVLRLDCQRATVEVRALYTAGNADWRYSIPEGSPDADALAAWQTFEADTPGTHTSQLVALLDSMDCGERPLVSGAEARRILEFVSSLYKAARTGEPVMRGSIVPGDPYYEALHGGELLSASMTR